MCAKPIQKHPKSQKVIGFWKGLKLPRLPDLYICKVWGSVEASSPSKTYDFLTFMMLLKLKPFKNLWLCDFFMFLKVFGAMPDLGPAVAPQEFQ